MGDVVLEDENLIQLNKEEYNLWRKDEASQSSPCHAPYVSLDVRETGEVYSCSHSASPIGCVGNQTLESIWDGATLQSLRLSFQNYQINAKDCGTCVKYWKDGIPTKSPALVTFDQFAFPPSGVPYAPQTLRLDLRAPLSPLDFKTVSRWLPRLTYLHVIATQSVRDGSDGRAILDQVSKLPNTQRPTVTLHIQEGIPTDDEIPDGLTTLWVSCSRTNGRPSSSEEAALTKLAHSLKQRGAKLGLEILMDQQNWFHLYSWMIFAQKFGIHLRPLLVPPTQKESLAHCRGDVLSSLYAMVSQWLSQYSFTASQDKICFNGAQLLSQIQRWQRESIGALSQSISFAFPDVQHPIVQYEEALEPFLGHVLRIYSDPSVEGWLKSLVERPEFSKEARSRRAYRLAGLWLACVFQREETFSYIHSMLGTPQDAQRLIAEDQEALSNTHWAGWLDSWLERLNLKSLQPQRRQFLLGQPQESHSKATPKVTVIITSHNHEVYVENAIRSVLTQTRQDLQLLLIDDASQDETVRVAKRVQDPRLTIIQNSENLRHGQSLLCALEHVNTELVALMDADDLYHPERLEHCLSLLEAQSHVDVVTTGLAVIDRSGGICSALDSSPVFDGLKNYRWLQWYEEEGRLAQIPEDYLLRLLKGNSFITCSNFVGRTAFLRRHKEQWSRLEYCIDWQLYLSAALEGGLRYIPEAFLGYRLHQANQKWSHCVTEIKNWHFYVESNQVVARIIEHIFSKNEETNEAGAIRKLAETIESLQENTTLDWPGVLVGEKMERLGIVPKDLTTEEVGRPLQALIQLRDQRREVLGRFSDPGEGYPGPKEVEGEISFLRNLRNEHEVLGYDHALLQSEMMGLLHERTNLRREMCLAEKEREQVMGENEALHQEIHALKKAEQGLNAQLSRSVADHHALQLGLERRVGEFVLDRLHGRFLMGALDWMKVKVQRHSALVGLTLSRWMSWSKRSRVLATACASFPIYSQTFVYQELLQMARRGFRLHLVYSFLESKGKLHSPFFHLWKSKRRLVLDQSSHQKDFDRYRVRYPEKVNDLIHRLSEVSGLKAEEVTQHPNFLQAFSYTRLVEAYRPQYLHSYFFYDRSLMSLVASYLLDIPRGMSCYADHVLKDYELKVVPLHLELCDLVIATSERIKRELLELAPQADPSRILVKPNAIDTKWFPVVERRDPIGGEPFRLVCVNRIEPKKGLLFLVEAVAQLRQQGFNVELHIVGTADKGIQTSQDYKQRVDELISQLDLWGAVHLEGHHNQEGILRFLGAGHMFVAPYVETDYGDKDGIPTALLEAMATGLPVVATNAGSIGEVIEHDQEGLVVAQRDAQALAVAVGQLLKDLEKRIRLGKRAAVAVRERFDVNVCEYRFHERVRSLIEARKKNNVTADVTGLNALLRWKSPLPTKSCNL